MLLLPLMGFLIVFWAVYQQMTSNFTLQACQMDLRVGDGQISATQLNLLDTLVILLAIPLFDRVVYPAVEARLGARALTPLRKMGVGFVFGALSMVCAAAVEVARKRSALIEKPLSNCKLYSGQQMRELSVFWQVK